MFGDPSRSFSGGWMEISDVCACSFRGVVEVDLGRRTSLS